ncbi:MAG: hypothetical protein KAI17_27000, partial [Thiotrichaceae bacterium]|nr:hypothetical protein [Thiotrichaceae bacterium]
MIYLPTFTNTNYWQLIKTICLSMLTMAIYLISPQLAYAANVTPATNSKCQEIVLPANQDLVDFET